MQFDYIVVGAGSAGCILANRLSEDPNNSVLLVEAGGSDKHIMVSMPTGLSYPMNTRRFNWRYMSQPEPYMNDRVIHTARGKGLGGSSSINGMAYVRGHACDFDQWEQRGASGWNYQACLPYFRKLENWMRGADEYRGSDGPVGVNCGNNMALNPLYQAFIDAGVEAGYGFTPDYNGYRQEGFGPMQMNVARGVRQSTSRRYLRPAKHRKNLTLFTHTTVQKLQFDGKTCTGVVIQRRGKSQIIRANKEVILSAGAIASPQLLQVSGIGPAAVLRQAGIQPLVDRVGVGENLQDHLEVFFQYECTSPVSLNRKLNLVSKAMIGARWLLFKTGLGATNHFEACAFIRSDAGKKWPDIQYHFLPAAMSYDGNVAFSGDGYQVHVGPNKPHSRGHVRARSSNINDHPDIQYNYFQHSDDVSDWRKTIRLTREILMQDALSPFRGEEIQPGVEVNTDDEIDHWVRANAETAYHPSCTCPMGQPDDPQAVVDPDCNVIGVERLRVVDSSIFPTITNGNLNAPSMMVAEKGADLILGKPPLTLTSEAEVWIDPVWQTKQR